MTGSAIKHDHSSNIPALTQVNKDVKSVQKSLDAYSINNVFNYDH